jgi:hypothetical protein
MRGKVARAMWTIRNLTTEEGQRKYGPRFISHDEWLMQHACAAVDPRCDQGHFGPQFATFHRLQLLRYELALLAVDPQIEAMPYWSVANDAIGGRFHDDPERYIFSEHFFGSRRGTGPEFEVQDGLFANWPVSQYSSDRLGGTSPMAHRGGRVNRCIVEEWFASIAKPCKCDEDVCPTFLRHHDSCRTVVSRWHQDPAQGSQSMPTGDGMFLDEKGHGGHGGTWDLRFTEADFNHCVDPRRTPTWMEWQNCIELSAGACFEPGSEEHNLRMSTLRTLLHDASLEQSRLVPLQTIFAHLAGKMPANCSDTVLLGYFRRNQTSPDSQERRGYVNYFHSQVHSRLGLDFVDHYTSPNDAAAFTSYHGDVDRSNFHWMHAARRQLEGVKWAYPSSQSVAAAEDISGPKPYGASGPFSIMAKKNCGDGRASDYTGESPWLPGTLWGDVVSSGFPFYDLFEDYDGGAHGYTHGDVLTLTAPDRTPYTYDTLEHLYY